MRGAGGGLKKLWFIPHGCRTGGVRGRHQGMEAQPGAGVGGLQDPRNRRPYRRLSHRLVATARGQLRGAPAPDPVPRGPPGPPPGPCQGGTLHSGASQQVTVIRVRSTVLESGRHVSEHQAE